MRSVKFHECNSKTYLTELRKQCEAFLTNGNPKSLDSSMTNSYLKVFQEYTRHDIKSIKNMIIHYLNAIVKEIDARAHNEEELWIKQRDVKEKWDNERMIQPQEGMVNMVKDKCNVGLVVMESSRTELEKQHVEQPKFINERKVDQDAEQCLDKHPLLASVIKNKTVESLNQTLESENDCLKKTIAQLQKDFSKLEALSSKVETNQCDEIKVKVSFDEIKTKNIELEHQVASLLKENEHLKLVYKNLFDSIKKSRVQTQKENLRSTLSEFAINHILGKDDSSSSLIAESHIFELEKC
ncbi:hypothetical protein Tco_0770705 [Tanacetum coccineum]|uniref:Uncharacterized protein n=1 Tax=Tanacetum coccineum TaxID=301880 RepID=A0ABQ4ZCY9_9ASTR